MILPTKSDLHRPVSFREYDIDADNRVVGKTVTGTLRFLDRMNVIVLVGGGERVFNRAGLEFVT